MGKANQDFLDAMWKIPDSPEATLVRLANRTNHLRTPMDQRCYDLAMVFLKNHGLGYPNYARQLGLDLQEFIEEWIENTQFPQEKEEPDETTRQA